MTPNRLSDDWLSQCRTPSGSLTGSGIAGGAFQRTAPAIAAERSRSPCSRRNSVAHRDDDHDFATVSKWDRSETIDSTGRGDTSRSAVAASRRAPAWPSGTRQPSPSSPAPSPLAHCGGVLRHRPSRREAGILDQHRAAPACRVTPCSLSAASGHSPGAAQFHPVGTRRRPATSLSHDRGEHQQEGDLHD